MKKSNYSSIETIIKIAKKGGMYILVDDEKEKMREILSFQPQIPMLKILILWQNMEED